MAEVGVAGSIVGIVSLAWSLSKKLYEFGSTTSAAGEQVDFIARNVTNYACALELLADRFDDDNPVHSARAIKVVDNLYDQSCDLFDRIEDMLPEPRRGRDDLSFLQKLAWNFKKKNVEFLASQIEYLKTTTNLLATILFAGRRIRARRRSHKHKRASKSEKASVENDQARVNVAIVEQIEACKTLSNLESQVNESMNAVLEAAEDNVHAQIKSSNGLVLHQNGIKPILAIALPQGGEESSAQRQAVLLQVDDTFQQLLSQFTTVKIETDEEQDHITRSSQVEDTYTPTADPPIFAQSKLPPIQRHEKLRSSDIPDPYPWTNEVSGLKSKARTRKDGAQYSQRRDREQQQSPSTKRTSRRPSTVQSDHPASESEVIEPKHSTSSSEPTPDARVTGEAGVARNLTRTSGELVYEQEVDSNAAKWELHQQAARDHIMLARTRTATLGSKSAVPINSSRSSKTTTNPHTPCKETDEEFGDPESRTVYQKGKVSDFVDASELSTNKKVSRSLGGSYEEPAVDQTPRKRRTHGATQISFSGVQHGEEEALSKHVDGSEKAQSKPARSSPDSIPRGTTRSGDRDAHPDDDHRKKERYKPRQSKSLADRVLSPRTSNRTSKYESMLEEPLGGFMKGISNRLRIATRIRDDFDNGLDISRADLDLYEDLTGRSL